MNLFGIIGSFYIAAGLLFFNWLSIICFIVGGYSISLWWKEKDAPSEIKEK